MNTTLATGRKSSKMMRRLRREIQPCNCERIEGRGRGGELPFKESMSQTRKLQFHQPRAGSEAKKVILSRLGLHSYLPLACTKRGMGPTAKATEIMEPAIPADLR